LKPIAYEPYERLLNVTPAQGDVYVWCVSLAVPEDGFRPFEQVLSPDELARAGRFRFPVHRRHFVAARSVLRYLLAHCAKIPAADVHFKEGAYGKPELSGTGSIRFNVSHSGELGLYAIAKHREVGVDIEQHRPMDDLENVSRHYFARGEVTALEKLPLPDRHAAFFRCWSRKEAFVKGLGAGLSLPLDSFCVSIDEEPDLTIEGQLPGTGEWRLFDITPCPGYSAALVTQGEPGAIRCARVENAAKLIAELSCR
jgi:4'-phosphopantetheinyl transferase